MVSMKMITMRIMIMIMTIIIKLSMVMIKVIMMIITSECSLSLMFSGSLCITFTWLTE